MLSAVLRTVSVQANVSVKDRPKTAYPRPVTASIASDAVVDAMVELRSGNPERVRAALERLQAYDGVVKHLAAPFAPNRHEALSASDLFFSRYRADGRLTRDGRN